MTKLNQNCRILIAINTIHSVIDLFINTFLVAYFLHLTNNNIIPTSLFYIFNYSVLGCFFVIIGQYVKCGNKLLIYRLSFIINAALLLMVIYLKEDITRFIWFLGFISGVEKALFFSPQNLMTSIEASGIKLIRFNGYREAFVALAKIVMPFFLGWLISVESFFNATIFILFLTAVEFVLSYYLLPFKTYAKSFSLKSLMALALKRYNIKMSLLIDFFNGFIFNVLDVLVVLYIVYIFKTNMNLGIFTSVFAVVLTITNWVFGRFCRRASSQLLILCGFIGFAASLYFVADTTKLSFIIYNLALNSALQFVRIVITCLVFRISQDKSVSSRYRLEYLTLREIALNSGRCFGFLLVLGVALTGNPETIKYLIVVLSVMLIFISYFTATLIPKLFGKEAGRC